MRSALQNISFNQVQKAKIYDYRHIISLVLALGEKSSLVQHKEDRMTESIESIDGLSTFKTADELVGYVDLHKDTSRALISFSHLVQLAYLSGENVSAVSIEDLSCEKRHFVSLHSYDVEKMIINARNRIKDGIVKEDWKEHFVAFFENKDVDGVVSLDSRR